ncbi:MAG: UDP-N-acetylglucosamine 1-carboxyvinyltransferase [Chlorobi bacterium]|nr:UDP-N-acetylglucosamine 1-carboxyvinyltransferase [Chlorobiota bacterium]
MGTFIIEGGHRLRGDITPQGAKNEALQVISAVLLTDEEVVISNVPEILDVHKLIEILMDMGVKVSRRAKGTYVFQADEINPDYLISDEYRAKASGIRGSVMIMGPLLARFGRAFLPKPGGDKIGRRRLDTHFEGFKKLGASFRFNRDENFYGVEAERLEGGYVLLPEASVTGTANLLMAASLAKGKTTIYNAACEPYIQQLSKMLNRMGAKISGIGSNLLTIEGVEKLGGTEHRILPDMIEVGSWIGLAAMTRSDIRIKNASVENLGQIPDTFRKLGIRFDIEGDDIHIPEQEHYEIQTFIDGSVLTIYDAPWPGFTPDLLSIVLVTAIQAKGNLLVHQKMFESRLFFVDRLIDMGAEIVLCDPHRAHVSGLNHEVPLRGVRMVSPDIRAGISLLIAALSAQGTSHIHNIQQIDRGYEAIDEKLRALGAQIRRVDD